MSRKRPTDQDRKQVIHLFLSGLARGANAFDLARAIDELHPPNNTFPGEAFMRLSADALQLAGAGQDDPICYRASSPNGNFNIARAIAKGRTNQEIAAELFISLSTVKTYITRIQDKLGVRNRVEIAAWSWEHHIACE